MARQPRPPRRREAGPGRLPRDVYACRIRILFRVGLHVCARSRSAATDTSVRNRAGRCVGRSGRFGELVKNGCSGAVAARRSRAGGIGGWCIRCGTRSHRGRFRRDRRVRRWRRRGAGRRAAFVGMDGCGGVLSATDSAVACARHNRPDLGGTARGQYSGRVRRRVGSDSDDQRRRVAGMAGRAGRLDAAQGTFVGCSPHRRRAQR